MIIKDSNWIMGPFFEQDFLDAADKDKFACSKLHEIKQYLLIFLVILMLGMYHIICHMYIYKNISATIIQGRKLLIISRFWPRKLFKGGNYSRAETIRGNTVLKIGNYFLYLSSTIQVQWEPKDKEKNSLRSFSVSKFKFWNQE